MSLESNVKIVNELCSNPNYSHAVFGCFPRTGLGHWIQETNGPVFAHAPLKPKKHMELNRIIAAEEAYCYAFKNETSGPEFIARIVAEKALWGERFTLCYNDRQGDKRGNSHTDYILIVPNFDGELVSIIKPAPEILIEIFRNVFPGYDRSDGKLQMDEKKPYSEKA